MKLVQQKKLHSETIGQRKYLWKAKKEHIEQLENMDYPYLPRSVAVVCFVLFQCASSVSIQKQSKLSLSQGAPIRRRSANTVEFFMNSDSGNKLSYRDDPLEVIALASEQDFNNMLVCPEKISTGLNDPVHKRSNCPWYYRVSRDVRRFPVVIHIAEPLCDYAIDSKYTVECVPITKSLPVLRLLHYLDENGNYIWVEETMTTIIGFTAAGRRLAQPTAVAPNNQATPEWAKR